jgi:hypothetical protein
MMKRPSFTFSGMKTLDDLKFADPAFESEKTVCSPSWENFEIDSGFEIGSMSCSDVRYNTGNPFTTI